MSLVTRGGQRSDRLLLLVRRQGAILSPCDSMWAAAGHTLEVDYFSDPFVFESRKVINGKGICCWRGWTGGLCVETKRRLGTHDGTAVGDLASSS
jgi:hypothetical protein